MRFSTWTMVLSSLGSVTADGVAARAARTAASPVESTMVAVSLMNGWSLMY
jgi:hypothetical protein